MNNIKRYLTFFCGYYYPSGGFEDFIGQFDTQDEAKDFCIKYDTDGYTGQFHIVDLKEFKYVKIDADCFDENEELEWEDIEIKEKGQ